MQKLYLDCDGVILDTINLTYKMLSERGITKRCDVVKFYREACWDELIIEAGEIDNSIAKIKELTNCFDVEILTHVNSEKEAISKLKYFNKELPMVHVITVPKEIQKADFISPNGAILVDDCLPNLECWYEKGGIPIKFSDSKEKCKFTVITDLLELLIIQKKIKTEVKE